MSCCQAMRWTPNQVRELSLGQIYPFITKQETFKDSGAAIEAAAMHQQELTRIAKRELEACRG